jgi:hypothetical protein
MTIKLFFAIILGFIIIIIFSFLIIKIKKTVFRIIFVLIPILIIFVLIKNIINNIYLYDKDTIINKIIQLKPENTDSLIVDYKFCIKDSISKSRFINEISSSQNVDLRGISAIIFNEYKINIYSKTEKLPEFDLFISKDHGTFITIWSPGRLREIYGYYRNDKLKEVMQELKLCPNDSLMQLSQ